MLQIRHTDAQGPLRFRRYEHDRLGLVETLTLDSVVYVRPCFGLIKTEPGRMSQVDRSAGGAS